ncbi:hypothetical protein GPECTOR_20g436 [Gonium pectorale]|uniref:Protein kinase domain-containing protein n=1 Tax=Gonium pectorale TaxID=33097 RepID=A0A150GJE6_GONPE|nr:hypothetical protein GPECTOR_20g436 [Gonium pectorale]|eukprot:KXZ49580.1 hypothetical protein GPECTOR_20g436 [Gonium pectorale]
MDVDAERRTQQRAQLRGLGIADAPFLDAELDGLEREGYIIDAHFLGTASREGLREAGLRAARIDEIFSAREAPGREQGNKEQLIGREVMDELLRNACKESYAQADSSCSQLQRAAGAQEPAGPPQSVATAAVVAVTGADVPPPPPAQHAWLELLAERAHGGDGMLFDGTVDGTAAVIKVYLWDRAGLAAFYREATAYRALASLQGSVVPQVLLMGKMRDGLRYLALRPVGGGRPLSWVGRPFQPAVVRAALRALEAAQHACGGFVHGDISLDNILLVEAPGGTATGGTAAASEAGGTLAGAAGGVAGTEAREPRPPLPPGAEAMAVVVAAAASVVSLMAAAVVLEA